MRGHIVDRGVSQCESDRQALRRALPGARLNDIVAAIERAAQIDAGVARYAGDDAARFATTSA